MFLRGVVLKKIGQAIRAEISFESADWSPRRSVVLRGVHMKAVGQESYLEAKEITVNFELGDLLAGKINLDDITLVEPVISVRMDAEGNTNLDPFFDKSGKPGKSAQVEIGRFVLQRGVLNFHRQFHSGNEERMTIRHLDMRGENIGNKRAGKLNITAGVQYALHRAGVEVADKLEGTLSLECGQELGLNWFPKSITARAKVLINETSGQFAFANGLVANLESRLTPVELENFQINFQHEGNPIGNLLLSGPIDFENGAGDYVWNRGEDIFLRYDSIRVAGEWIEAYNYNLDLSLWIENGVQTQWWPSRDEYDDSKDYNQGNIIYYKQMLWVASIPTDAGVEPLSIHADLSDDGERNNPWRLVYPWQGGEQMIIKPQKFFVDGDNWYSDMTVLGKEIGIPDMLDLDTIKVVPNPYKARSRFNETSNERRIRFTHLPKKCQISIYTITGEHVTTFAHDAEFDSNEWWNLRTGNNQDGPEVAPGLYIYVIEFPEEKKYTINTYNYDDSYLYMPSFLLKNDKKEPEKTKYYIGKFAVIR